LPAVGVLTHVSVPSLQESVVQVSESLQLGRPVQSAEEVQVSLIVQNRPSLQLCPVRAVQDVGLVAGAQTSHSFAGLVAPPAQQLPPIAHEPPATVLSHRSIASLHESEVHGRLSSQLRATPTHCGVAVHASPTVQYWPSSQLVPTARSVHARAFTDGSQTWHWLSGLAAPPL
jgi:hypothetical protein